MDVFIKLEQELNQLPPTANERSFYTSLNNFLKSYANYMYKTDTYSSVAEESGHSEDKHIGFPDLTLRNKGHAAGWVEVKNPGEQLDSSKHLEQFTRYKNSFENLIITNLEEWQLWQWDSEGKSVKVKSIDWDAYHQKKHGSKEISDLLHRFLEGTAHEVRTPKQLAIALARKTQVLRDQVKESYKQATEDSQLAKLKDTFESTLIQNISEHQFANMVAETIAYSLFLARLEYEEKHNGKDFNVEIVQSFLPKNVPVLRDLYEIILRVAQNTPIAQAINLLVDQLNAADIERIRHKLTDHKAGEDPVIQFYEPFLGAYDPLEREARGVYYTPKPLVDYIVRGVDHILKTRFDKKLGLADETVQILDPATGSGTFLMSSVQQVHYNLKQAYGGLGEEELEKRFQQNVLQHVLKHFYGFELLMAPYAVAHLKLTLELERMGFDWSLSANDGDQDNNRLKVYLANSLDDPNQPPKLDLPGFHLAEESNKARDVKKNAPILAVIGNPPYSGVSMNMQPEMRALVEQYKYIDGEKVKEKGALQLEKNLNDDYVKFIAFAQKTISSNSQGGVVAFVTNNGYLNNPTLRGLRKSLLDTFDEVCIYNLYGATQNKPSPDDKSVFNIQLGTSVCFLVKNNIRLGVRYKELIGPQNYKLTTLASEAFEGGWEEVIPKSPLFSLIPSKDPILEEEYNKGFNLGDLFKDHQVGIVTAADGFFISEKLQELKDNIETLKDWLKYNKIENIKALGKSVSKRIIKNSKYILNLSNPKISSIFYRPFDERLVINEPKAIEKPQTRTWDNFTTDNVGLVVTHQVNENFSHIFITNKPIESSFISNKTKEINYIFRVFNSGSEANKTLFDSHVNSVNINDELAKHIASNLNVTWNPGIKPNFSKQPSEIGPLGIIDYSYAVLHSPQYREKYKYFLKSDFPRVPYPANGHVFWKLVTLGGQLRSLHLMGDDPFSAEPEILKDSSKWGIQPRGQRDGSLDWKVEKVEYDDNSKVYVNDKQYFEGIEPAVWGFYIGGYQVMDKWLKDRKKSGAQLTADDRLHYVKIAVVLRETIRIQKEIDTTGFMDQKQSVKQ